MTHELLMNFISYTVLYFEISPPEQKNTTNQKQQYH